MQFHLTDDVDFLHIGTVHVSTCDTLDAGLETAIFFPDNHSVVVARYLDIEAAVVGHHAFMQRDVLRFMAENHKGSL